MPFKYYIDANINCILLKHSESMEMEEFNIHFQMVFEDTRHAGDMNILRDCSEAGLSTELTWERMTTTTKERMEFYNKKFGSCNVARVVHDAKDYARIHQYLVSDRLNHRAVQRRNFRDMAETRRWLEITDDYVFNYPD